MKGILLLLISVLFISCQATNQNNEVARVNLILDTDIGPDYDDVGAMAVMHALADSGEANIIATISSNMDEHAVPCIEVINNYFNRPDIPVGATKGSGVSLTTWHKEQKWPVVLTEKYKYATDKTSDAPDAVAVYRKILSLAADNSLTICSIGFMTNLRNLLESGADQYSNLSGQELVAKKVNLLVSMAGEFPQSKKGEFNIKQDAVSASYVAEHWPAEILLSGFEIGKDILTGKPTSEMPVSNSPIKETYQLSLAQDNPYGRNSWDQTAVLVAIKGYEPYYTALRGTLIVDQTTGANSWIQNDQGRHAYLVKKMPDEQIALLIEKYMMHQPVKK